MDKRKLQVFVNSYFNANPPTLKFIKFKKQENCAAQANRENNVIQIDLNKIKNAKSIGYAIKVLKKPKKFESFEHGKHYIYLNDTVKPTPEELVLLTLLHEIGHFKLKDKFKKLERQYSRIKEKFATRYRQGEKYLEADDVVKRRKGESFDEWQGRITGFQYFCELGHTIEEEIECDKWALKEFKKKLRRHHDSYLQC